MIKFRASDQWYKRAASQEDKVCFVSGGKLFFAKVSVEYKDKLNEYQKCAHSKLPEFCSRAIEVEDKVSGGIMAMKPELACEIREDERWKLENPEVIDFLERGLKRAAKGQFTGRLEIVTNQETL